MRREFISTLTCKESVELTSLLGAHVDAMALKPYLWEHPSHGLDKQLVAPCWHLSKAKDALSITEGNALLAVLSVKKHRGISR